MEVLSILNIPLKPDTIFFFLEQFVQVLFSDFVITKYEVNGHEYDFYDTIPDILGYPIFCVTCEASSMFCFFFPHFLIFILINAIIY
jgi:hypothetical protein